MLVVLVAQADAAGNGAANAPPAEGPSWFIQYAPFVLIPLLGYYMLFLPERQRKERLEKLMGVKEKDHIVTTSGIHGVVTQVNREQGRATVRVDESTGAKIRIELTAIAKIVSGDENSGDAKKDSK
jgi:preprotein translocase subunit YajC